MHIVGYLYEDYHDARSLEHKVTHKPNLLPTKQYYSDQINKDKVIS